MTTRTIERGQRGVNRVLQKLDNSIEDGNYYEAHQMYRTLYFRYTSQNKFEDCLDLLYNGAIKLAEKQQEASAADLGLLLLDTLEKRGIDDTHTDNDIWVQRLCEMICCLSSGCVERETIINRAIKWSGEMSNNNYGHPVMHKLIAQLYWTEKNIEQARHHFLLCRDGNLFARMLIKISDTKGFRNEVDLFIVQAVLQQLCIKDRKNAEEAFKVYTKKHPQICRAEPPFKQPLLNFIYMLFRSIELGRLDSFRSLCDLYKKALSRDEAFMKYLTKIGTLYFGVVPPPSGIGGGIFGGTLGDLFSLLSQGFDADEDENSNENVNLSDGNSNELD